MEAACGDCGFAPEDYSRAGDRDWLARATDACSRLVFEGLPDGAVVAGSPSAAELALVLADLLHRGDIHAAVHLAHEAATESAALARGDRPLEIGHVQQINASGGGVPKLPVELGHIGRRGLEADRQASRKHHGHAWQALCLWSADVIEALQSEGHPIGFGYAGENLTLSGIDWTVMRAGMRLRIGPEVVARLTGVAVPCKQNAAWFLDGRFDRMSHARHPGWSRWYAAVLEPGVVRPGDEVRELSPSDGRS